MWIIERWNNFVFFPLPLSTIIEIFSSKGFPPPCVGLQVFSSGLFPPVEGCLNSLKEWNLVEFT
jgi:hypothetical protein